MKTDLLIEFLQESDKQRPNYSKSLGQPYFISWPDLKESLPDIMSYIYSKVSGTLYESEDESLVDFLPGYLLIHGDEFEAHKNRFQEVYKKPEFFPVLADYDSGYIAVEESTGEVFIFSVEDEEELMYRSFDKLLETGIACYREGAYTIDGMGLMEVDFDKEEEIGQRLNPDVEFWFE
jgi:hypothetical protein